MANIEKEDTGLPYNLWLDSIGKNRKNEHSGNPGLKINVNGNLIPIEISDNPEIPESVLKVSGKKFIKNLPIIKKYIKAYKEILLAHYNREITDNQVTSLLKNIGNAVKAKEELDKLKSKSTISKIKFYWDEEQLLFVIIMLNKLNKEIDVKYTSNKKILNNLLSNMKKLNPNIVIEEVK